VGLLNCQAGNSDRPHQQNQNVADHGKNRAFDEGFGKNGLARGERWGESYLNWEQNRNVIA